MKRFTALAKNGLRILLFLILVTSISAVIFWAINPNIAPSWTGIGEHKNASGEIEPVKTLWDWMELLIVPLVLALGVWWLNRSEKITEREIADKRNSLEQKLTTDRLQEAALQTYFDRMSELLLNANLRESNPTDEVRSIAHSRTLSVLRTLDSNRKGTLIRFLQESRLIDLENPIIDLAGADFSTASMFRIRLWESNLRSINFTDTNLSRAKLQKSNLSHAILTGSNLHHAYIILANLQSANLSNSDLSEIDLTESDLEFALLSNSDMRGCCLNWTKLVNADLSNCNLVNAKIHDANLSACNLSNSTLTGADFSRSKLVRVNFSGADLSNAIFTDADLSFANLTHAKVTKEQLKNAASLLDTKFPKTILMP